jgi:hypothetical protein
MVEAQGNMLSYFHLMQEDDNVLVWYLVQLGLSRRRMDRHVRPSVRHVR